MIAEFMWKVWLVSFINGLFVKLFFSRSEQEKANAGFLEHFSDAALVVYVAAWWQGV